MKFLKAIVEGEGIIATSEFDAVMRLRAALPQAGIINASAKQESDDENDESDCNLEYLGVQDLSLDDLQFSQDSIGRKFRCGGTLERLVADLCRQLSTMECIFQALGAAARFS